MSPGELRAVLWSTPNLDDVMAAIMAAGETMSDAEKERVTYLMWLRDEIQRLSDEPGTNPPDDEVMDLVLAMIERLESLSPDQLAKVPRNRHGDVVLLVFTDEVGTRIGYLWNEIDRSHVGLHNENREYLVTRMRREIERPEMRGCEFYEVSKCTAH
jgi:hypothetical protein